MAIIRNVPRIYLIEQLVTELLRLSNSVARMGLSGDRQSAGVSSGWFITPDIVVVPGFNFTNKFNPPGLYDRILLDGPGPRQIEVSEAPELLGLGALPQAPPDAAAVALLKVRQPMPERVLPFSFDAPTLEHPVCLVHFPRGGVAPAVSFGEVKALAGDLLEYDADTEPGSSGAPVLDRSWRVMAMHVASDRARGVNLGMTRAALLKLLQGSKWWGEIAAHHRLADDTAAEAMLQETAPAELSWPSPTLVRAAISPRVDPKLLSAGDRSALTDLMVDPTAAEWVMRPGERRRVIAGAGSLAALRQARGASPTSSDPLQQVISDILDGPPYQIEAAGDDVLSAWIQASRWFEPVADDLPKPSDIAKTLARRRVRGQLDTLAGPEFQGRDNELGKLAAWYYANLSPLVLTGIGGIGKSALVARFAASLPADTALFWLDFDRADLAPDDAVSVLTALAAQAATQLDGFTPPELGQASWQDDGAALGQQLATLTEGRPALLVLDSFEAAQYAERYQELWPVIEAVARELPELRVCVTGRAQVPALSLNGRTASSLHLTGLPKPVARHWLDTKGVKDPRTVERIVTVARGIPLILKLALRLVETGGAIADVPKDLPKRLIAGYLYERILDRVQNPAFRPVASGLLVLRRLSVEMITPVLGDLVAMPKGDPSVWFAELSREMGLVEGTSVLLPRREVRSATLWLLERDQRKLVHEVDARAAQWYRTAGTATPEYAAELVYHLLRLGDIAGAAAAWREDCAPHLAFAADDIRGRAPRAWLRDRLGDTSEAAQSLEAWEEDAVKRIRAARARKLERAPAEILRERAARSAESPLLFHDAFELRAAGQAAAAIDLLVAAGEVPGRIGRDRVALRALLEWERGDRRAADALLRRIETLDLWPERTDGTGALAVLAARICLTVDIEQEVALLSADSLVDVTGLLAPADVVSPRLKQKLRPDRSLERGTPTFIVDQLPIGGPRLLQAVEAERGDTLPNEPPPLREGRQAAIEQWSRTPDWTAAALSASDLGLPDSTGRTLIGLAESGWRRWWLAATTSFLDQAIASITNRQWSAASQSYAAIAGTLALFVMNTRPPNLDAQQGPIFSSYPIRVSAEHWQHLTRLFRQCISAEENWEAFARIEKGSSGVKISMLDLLEHRVADRRLDKSEIASFLLFLLSPNPLLQLVHELAGSGPDPLGADRELL